MGKAQERHIDESQERCRNNSGPPRARSVIAEQPNSRSSEQKRCRKQLNGDEQIRVCRQRRFSSMRTRFEG